MSNLTEKAIEIAGLFRLSHHLEAGLLLADYFDELIELKNVDASDLKNAIRSIANCQECRDWLGLADYLEYELVHILGGSVPSAA